GTLAEDQATAHAADGDGEYGAVVLAPGLTRARGRVGCAPDEAVEVRAHQLRAGALGDGAGKDEGLCRFVDGEDGTYDLVLGPPFVADGKWEQEGGGGQARGELAQVLLIERQCGPPVE